MMPKRQPIRDYHRLAMYKAETEGVPDDLWFGSTAVTRYNDGNVISMSYPASTRLQARINGRLVRFKPSTHELLTLLLIRGPRAFTTRLEMIDLLYEHREDGGPLSAKNRIAQMFREMSSKGVPFESYYSWGVRIASAENR
jgi:hypothetical protein